MKNVVEVAQMIFVTNNLVKHTPDLISNVVEIQKLPRDAYFII